MWSHLEKEKTKLVTTKLLRHILEEAFTSNTSKQTTWAAEPFSKGVVNRTRAKPHQARWSAAITELKSACLPSIHAAVFLAVCSWHFLSWSVQNTLDFNSLSSHLPLLCSQGGFTTRSGNARQGIYHWAISLTSSSQNLPRFSLGSSMETVKP